MNEYYKYIGRGGIMDKEIYRNDELDEIEEKKPRMVITRIKEVPNDRSYLSEADRYYRIFIQLEGEEEHEITIEHRKNHYKGIGIWFDHSCLSIK